MDSNDVKTTVNNVVDGVTEQVSWAKAHSFYMGMIAGGLAVAAIAIVLAILV